MQDPFVLEDLAKLQGTFWAVTHEVRKARLAIDGTHVLMKQVDELLASRIIRARVWPPE